MTKRLNARVQVTRTSPRTATGRRTRKVIAAAVADLDRLRVDAGISLRRLAQAAEVDAGYLTQIIAGDRQPSVAVLVALASALGADLSIRAYPTSGPAIRDHLQARIVEELVRITDRSWQRSIEVPVFRPVRGFIDLVLDRRFPPDVVASEVQSRLERLEQTVRWSQDKAGSLPSSDLWHGHTIDPAIHRLLVLRSTRATREVARRFEGTLRAAYPAPARAVFRAITEADRAWPGDGMLWADVRGDLTTILDRPPRGVVVGR